MYFSLFIHPTRCGYGNWNKIYKEIHWKGTGIFLLQHIILLC